MKREYFRNSLKLKVSHKSQFFMQKVSKQGSFLGLNISSHLSGKFAKLVKLELKISWQNTQCLRFLPFGSPPPPEPKMPPQLWVNYPFLVKVSASPGRPSHNSKLTFHLSSGQGGIMKNSLNHHNQMDVCVCRRCFTCIVFSSNRLKMHIKCIIKLWVREKGMKIYTAERRPDQLIWPHWVFARIIDWWNNLKKDWIDCWIELLKPWNYWPNIETTENMTTFNKSQMLF